MSKYFNATEQADLFEGASATKKNVKADGSKLEFFSRHQISLRLDQTIILGIVLLCAFTFVFSMGVEKGKRYSIAEVKEERKKYEQAMHMLSKKVFKKEPKVTELKKEVPKVSKEASVKPKAVQEAKPASEDKIEIISMSPPVKDIEKRIVETLPAIPKKNFTIQMVTYQKEEAANRLIKKLTEKGHKAFIIPSGKFLQICLDAFESKQTASRVLRKLKSDGTVPSDAYVRTIPR